MSKTTETPRRTEYLPLGSLKPDPRNPKAHDTGTIDASIGRFGVIESIVLDGRTGHIVSGHGRTKTLTAMRDRGETPPEGIILDDAGEWLVPVITGWASRTDSEAAAALIALNRTTELGGWVDEALLDLLNDLVEDEDGLLGVGFTGNEVEDLRASLDGLADLDLDETGDEWDGESGLGSEGISIRVKDATLVATWKQHAAEHDGDEAALRALFGE